MEVSFHQAATASAIPENRLVITSDWQGTIADPLKGYNFDLLVFLRDAQPHHRVILTSTSSAATIRDMLEMGIEIADLKNIDLTSLRQIEIVTKSDLMVMTQNGLKVDIGFDDVSIATQTFALNNDQKFPYADPRIEVTLQAGFKTFPWTLDQLRTTCGLPQKGGTSISGQTPAAP